jgi:hypothetical protein
VISSTFLVNVVFAEARSNFIGGVRRRRSNREREREKEKKREKERYIYIKRERERPRTSPPTTFSF